MGLLLFLTFNLVFGFHPDADTPSFPWDLTRFSLAERSILRDEIAPQYTNDAELLELELTAYDPALGGINCDGDCSWLANGTRFSEDLYWKSAACPFEYVRLAPYQYRIWIKGWGEWVCNDTGDSIGSAVWSERLGRYVFRVDLMVDRDHFEIGRRLIASSDWRIYRIGE